ncbi:asparaginase domain-containing protein [Spirochaeta africana]|uniref:L-asparaginase/GlutRNAGln amidotransferase subunit D n=1 Tax=Spirochaeta africana (strain ATCC 700263 / DSM 8902 / Z-7692) TaxID=889378 RepID=H9UGY5_SPIAZ|nr:asparaginase domain-containing protein [Spirochaeta africana]AFG36778.1 L-asparaginase/GlutRNAGln amidotransferase subunit D [Spirochaeta africana DSM 8902]
MNQPPDTRETLWRSPWSDSDDPELRIIITGGTFDKRYDAISGQLGFAGTHLPDILQRVRCSYPVVLELNQLIDSLDMQPEHHRGIVDSCRRSPQRRIVITHGTDRLQHTARELCQAGLDAAIVLTGAMIPYSISNSESLFNLGSAIAAAGILPPGVYAAMNGRIFAGSEVRKDPRHGIFLGHKPTI